MANRLAQETSPYLLQHAHNPVDWHPWGPEALARAKAEDKPILLSVGYSACHWCHVMERESFEDAAIAAEMNRGFINVKVDREERPDLDELYMQSVQAFTGGHGGWPMTVFLTPEGRPFLGGTYFPPEPRHGMPSFSQVMRHALGIYTQRKADLARVTGDLVEHLGALARMPAPADASGVDWLGAVAAACAEDFDPEHGGFGEAPKFPPHGSLAALLAHHHLTRSRRSLEMVTLTLDGMARGGMYDLLAGGFARYSVDERWLIPHFEKMLYDNAQLVPVYVDAWRVTGQARYARVARETCDYVLRELGLPGGAFAASQDADSEGEEGLFFTWTPAELREALGLFDGTRVAALLGVHDGGNFEHGRSVLRLEQPLEDQSPEDRALLERALPRLLALRAQRVAPGRDDKVISAWNGLMISALARAGDALGEPRYVEAAAGAARFLAQEVTREGRLHRTWKDGRVGAPAFLDDHANLGQGLLDLYEATGEEPWLDASLELAGACVALFWDEAEGGFFYTGADAEPLIARSRNLFGGATPSGNGVAALWFTRLEELTGRADLGERARALLDRLAALVPRAARALGPEALAGAWRQGRSLEIGVLGEAPGPLLEVLRRHYLPFAVRSVSRTPSPRVPWMAGRKADPGGARAYVCERGACLLPVSKPEALDAQLRELTTPPPPKAPARVRAPALPGEAARWLNGAPLSLEDLRGHVVVLDFFTSCCVNCLHVLPELRALERATEGLPVVVLGVHSPKFDAERDPEMVARALAALEVDHRVVLDPERALWSQYAVRAWPTLVVLDTRGRVAWQRSGEVEARTLLEVVQDLLAEAEAEARPAPLPPATPAEAPHAALSAPEKLATWPDAADQARGEDPFGPEARVYLADTGHHRVLELAVALGADGWPSLSLLRAFGDGRAGLVDGEAPRFRHPRGLCRDGRWLWVADTGNHAVRRVDLETGEVRTAAGTGRPGRGRPKRDPRALALRSPWDVAAGGGVVFVAMAGDHRIHLLDPERGRVSPYVGSGVESHVDGAPDEAALAQPSGLALVGRYLFWVDAETSSVRLLDLAEARVGTICGQGLFDFGDVDGGADEIRLQHPLGLTFAEDGLYVADTYNHKLKRIALAPEVQARTVAEGLAEPGGVAALGGFVLVADTGHHRVAAWRRADGALRALEIAGLNAPSEA